MFSNINEGVPTQKGAALLASLYMDTFGKLYNASFRPLPLAIPFHPTMRQQSLASLKFHHTFWWQFVFLQQFILMEEFVRSVKNAPSWQHCTGTHGKCTGGTLPEMACMCL